MAKKRFFNLFVLMLCIFTVPFLSGCTLVTVNAGKQLEETVASFDNGSIVVDREELIITYNSIGNSRFDSSGVPTKEGIEKTIELAMNRNILIEFLTSDNETYTILRKSLNVEKVELTTYQANEIWRDIYEYLNASIKSLEDEIRAKAGATLPVDDTEEEEESKVYKYANYEKTYTYNGETGQLEKILAQKPVENKSVAPYDVKANLTFDQRAEATFDTFRTKYWQYTDSKILDPKNNKDNPESYSDQAFTKFTNQLIKSDKNKGIENSTDKQSLMREVERVYEIYYKNAILTAFQERYKEAEVITSNDVYQKFLNLYKAQVEEYTANPSAFETAMPTGAQEVYYLKNPDDFFKVNHILFKFSDEQTAEIEKLKTKLDNNVITNAVYESEVAKIKAATKAYNRETEEYEPITLVITKLNAALNASTNKFYTFGEFMHRYSQDDATLNAEACYYIPTKESGIADTMDKNFADTSRKLFEAGITGAISEPVESTYGYHIIMYTGKAQAIDVKSVTDEESDNLKFVLSQLNAYYLNPLYNKTMLDQVLSKVTLDSYATYEQNILDTIKAGKEITMYEKTYKDLY